VRRGKSHEHSHGDGGIDQRGENSWRLRYRLNGKRYSQAFRGTKTEAQARLRDLIQSGETGEHIEPSKITVGQWIEHWLKNKTAGKKKLGRRAHERCSGLLRDHVIPVLGNRRLQKLTATEIDNLYVGLADKPATHKYIHIVLKAYLCAAVRKKLISVNRIDHIEEGNLPAGNDADHGVALEPEELTRLLTAFRSHPLSLIVTVAAWTGARRGEILALRWTDFDLVAKTLKIERALDKANTGITFKVPKSERGKRTITIDDGLSALLIAEKEKYLRFIAGVSDTAKVDLSLVKLPAEALIFPGDANLIKPREPGTLSSDFPRAARRFGFNLRFHDLRGTHATMLLDAGVPVHTVAKRLGHSAAVLLQSYAKRTKKADESAAEVIGNLSRGLSGPTSQRSG
jgi:integrase